MLTVVTSSSIVLKLSRNLFFRRISIKRRAIESNRFSSYVVGYVNHNLTRFPRKNPQTLLQSFIKCFSTDTGYSTETELSSVQYEKICEETIDSLTEHFEELVEAAAHLPDADVSYGDGVLTVKFGEPHGTYVINRQSPNKQIWLSSPKSGPKRYDFINGQWIYKHDRKSLHELLNNEIPAIVRSEACFDKCSFSGQIYIKLIKSWKKKSAYISAALAIKLNKLHKAKMEIMEDGNLVDRVRILLQRDMQYYQEMQTVLREPLCIRISGGKLDFPRHASFAAIKIVTWWEADFVAAFKRTSGLSSAENENTSSVDSEDGVIKQIQPSEFILLVVDTAEQLLEHLHTLIQESLDHADLTVLTATLGAAALIRNCLWCYNQHAKGTISSQSSEKINKSHKAFNEMAEAVAERLLDLHCRLISLYILNEADSLSWHSNKPFFERERCSYVIQMWWLYMQGTKADLWNTVSPKMAQRVFSEMLNESLSIITTRFIHGRPTLARSEQFWSDAFNVLCCTGYLALGACVDSDGMIGARPNNLPTVIRDMHAKCNELLICLLLRGTPLKELYQIFRHGLENLAILRPRRGPAPWLLICAPNLLGLSAIDSPADMTLSEDKTVILELNVLRHQPQPNWPQLMKVISMSNYAVARMLLKTLIRQNVGVTCVDDSDVANKSKKDEKSCSGFLCNGSACDKALKITSTLALYSLFHVLVVTVNEPEHVIISALKQDPNWSNYLDRQQVWNQSRPPWLNALIKPLKTMMQPVVEVLIEAVKTGASIYQAMSLAIGCFAELYVTASTPVLRAAFALNDNIPAHCRPIGGDVLLQVLCAALYSTLLDVSTKGRNEFHDTLGSGDTSCELSPFNPYDRSTAATALAEAICSIDEDNKHTSQIDSFLLLVKDSLSREDQNPRNGKLQNMACIIETYTDELLFTNIGRRSLKIAYEYLVRASDWVLDNLRRSEQSRQIDLINLPEISPIVKPLTHIMFHIEDTCFDQFMANYEATNWSRALTMPLSITLERVRGQILLRPEFKNVGDLSHEDKEVAQSIKRICSFVRSARFK